MNMPQYKLIVVTKEFRTVLVDSVSVEGAIDKAWADIDHVLSSNPVVHCATDMYVEGDPTQE
jgi:hypothetical protein